MTLGYFSCVDKASFVLYFLFFFSLLGDQILLRERNYSVIGRKTDRVCVCFFLFCFVF